MLCIAIEDVGVCIAQICVTMSYQDSGFSTMYDRQDDYDLDEDNEEYLEEDRDAEEQDESDEGNNKKKLRTSA